MGDEASRRLSTLFDTTSAQEMTRCLGQLCNQVSLSSIKVPRFDSFSDVFEFLTEFELITTGLESEQKALLLTKAFPVGCNRSWYETDLKPLIQNKARWSEIREFIVRRFSDDGEQDRHFTKVKDISFDPEGDKSLLNFIEDLLYSFKRAFGDLSEDFAVKYIKASIPKTMRPLLNSYAEFRDAKTVEMIKQAAKRYDFTKGSSTKSSSSREATRELAGMLQEIVKSIKRDNEDTRKAVATAFKAFESNQARDRTSRPPSPSTSYFRPNPSREHERYDQTSVTVPGHRYKRSASPRREESQWDRRRSPQRYDRNLSSNRPGSPGYGRLVSPGRSDNRPYNSVADRPPTPGVRDTEENKNNESEEVINSDMYYARFGKPPTPCSQCKAMHWNKHCPFYLN